MKARSEAIKVSERLKAESDGSLKRYHEKLVPIRQIAKARDERKDKTVPTLTKLRLLHEKGQKVARLH